MAPLGYFDPLGLSPVGDEGRFRRFREAELKHGRVAMMASAGLVAQHYIKWPGFSAVPAGAAAVETDPGKQAWIGLIVVCGILEFFVWKQDYKKQPGDFGDPLGLTNVFGYTREIREKELNNGRLAMFTALGILWAELATGKDAIISSLLSASQAVQRLLQPLERTVLSYFSST